MRVRDAGYEIAGTAWSILYARDGDERSRFAAEWLAGEADLPVSRRPRLARSDEDADLLSAVAMDIGKTEHVAEKEVSRAVWSDLLGHLARGIASAAAHVH